MTAMEMLERPVQAAAADPGPFALSPLALLAIAAAGLVGGLGSAAIAVNRDWDPGRIAVGAWTVRPGVGTPAIDPYARARAALGGTSSMAANEGLAFLARVDDTGYRLVLGCTYRLGGAIGPARFWTLTAQTAEGRSLETQARRTAFTSSTVIRDVSGAATLEIGPEARPGNWLPTSGVGPMELVLRFYDTPLADTRADLAAATLPAITRLSCAGSDAVPKP